LISYCNKLAIFSLKISYENQFLVVEIDGIDKEILRDLMEDARKPILQIANKIGYRSNDTPALTQTGTIGRDIWF
jgi:hypothetical protein